MLAAGNPARLVLIIDQFEQVFAADGRDGRLERTAFIDAVCAAATQPTGLAGEPPARVVIAVRGDYWDRCAAYPQLVRAMKQDQLVVGPMREASLRRAITGPARRAGCALIALSSTPSWPMYTRPTPGRAAPCSRCSPRL